MESFFNINLYLGEGDDDKLIGTRLKNMKNFDMELNELG
jgi:hypothetical protein